MKRLYKALLVLIAWFVVYPALAANPSGYEQLLQRAEQLLKSYKDSEALQVYEEVLSISENNYEALCKASFLHCRIGDRFSDETRKMQHFQKAKEYALRAYGVNPDDAESNYVMALSLGSYAMVTGPKQRLTAIHELKTYVDAALACNSEHAGAWYILGRWCYKMANLNVAEQMAAKFLFGGLNEKPTNTDAVNALRNAIAYNPNNIRYYYDLASVYHDMRDTTSCVQTLSQALTVTDLETREDLELSRRCKIMLQDFTKK